MSGLPCACQQHPSGNIGLLSLSGQAADFAGGLIDVEPAKLNGPVCVPVLRGVNHALSAGSVGFSGCLASLHDTHSVYVGLHLACWAHICPQA